jgi:hypothetical protein
LNPYGIRSLPTYKGSLTVRKEEDDPELLGFKRMFLGCEWFQVYDIVEELFAQLIFHEEELAAPDEEPRALPMQRAINEYFEYAGIGWQVINGKIATRGDELFENTVRTACDALSATRPTAEARLHTAIESLSKRPKPDTAGAVSDAITAIECIISDVVGAKAGKKISLGDFLNDEKFFPGSMKAAMAGLWGYACNEGARHGKEGVEPDLDQARFAVAVCAAIATLLNSTHPRPK